MKDKEYIAIIGDLVKSREITERAQVQEELRRLLDEMNHMYAPHLAANFVITLGDEFQGLVHRDFPFVAFWDHYDKQFGQAHATRFGIGLGNVNTAFQDTAVGMDGPCFHHARDALNMAKKSKKEIVVAGFEHNTALSALIDAMLDIKRNWSDRQVEVIEKYQLVKNINIIAEKLDISKQAVSLIMAKAKWDLYSTILQGIQDLFFKR